MVFVNGDATIPIAAPGKFEDIAKVDKGEGFPLMR